LSAPLAVALDSVGSLYIADYAANRIRKVTNGIISTVAGDGTYGFGGDGGPALSAQLAYPSGIALDAAGNLYIADSNNNRVRNVSNGVITTVAGNGFPPGGAQLNIPTAVAVDSAGDLYIADGDGVRKSSKGVITMVAGNGKSGFGGDGGPAVF